MVCKKEGFETPGPSISRRENFLGRGKGCPTTLAKRARNFHKGEGNPLLSTKWTYLKAREDRPGRMILNGEKEEDY